MSAHITYMLIAVFAIATTISISPAFAGQEACPNCEDEFAYEQADLALLSKIPISVWTDSSVYQHGSEILVEGKVANIKSGIPITLMVTSPLGNIITIDQIMADGNGNYKTRLNTMSNLWKYDGTYTIRVQYGAQETNNKVMVDLIGGIVGSQPGTGSCGITELNLGSGNCIPYTISGATIIGAFISSEDTSIIIRLDTVGDARVDMTIIEGDPMVKTTKGGVLTLEIPRSVLDAKMGLSDDELIVLIDGEQTNFEEIKTATDRFLRIGFPEGAEKVEVIGTFVVPEFGTIAAMILAVAIISIIAVSARTKLSILPKF